MRKVIAIAMGGFAGGLARYGVGSLVGGSVATLALNVVGAFLLAVLVTLPLSRRTADVWELKNLAGAGFLGSFTTFSTWMLEVERLHAGGQHLLSAAHLLGSTASGLVAAALGLRAGRGLGNRRRVQRT